MDRTWTCEDCGITIPTGIIGISEHWSKCGGKDFTNALIDLKKEKGTVIIEDALELREKYLPNASL